MIVQCLTHDFLMFETGNAPSILLIQISPPTLYIYFLLDVSKMLIEYQNVCTARISELISITIYSLELLGSVFAV